MKKKLTDLQQLEAFEKVREWMDGRKKEINCYEVVVALEDLFPSRGPEKTQCAFLIVIDYLKRHAAPLVPPPVPKFS